MHDPGDVVAHILHGFEGAAVGEVGGLQAESSVPRNVGDHLRDEDAEEDREMTLPVEDVLGEMFARLVVNRRDIAVRVLALSI